MVKDVTFLYPVADALHMELSIDGDGVSGNTSVPFKAGSFKLNFALEVVSSQVDWNDRAALILRGPGDFMIYLEYHLAGKKILLYIVDAGTVPGGPARLNGVLEDRKMAFPDIANSLIPHIVAGFSRNHGSTKWASFSVKKV